MQEEKKRKKTRERELTYSRSGEFSDLSFDIECTTEDILFSRLKKREGAEKKLCDGKWGRMRRFYSLFS